MGRVLTNNVNLAYSIESALGTAGTTWFNLEPNEIGVFGAEFTTVSRNPISRNRQRRKGTTTDLDSSVEFDVDLTLSSFRDFIEGFCFVTAVNREVTGIATSAAETTGDSYTVPSVTAAQEDKLEVDTLLWVEGFANAANNGLKTIDTDVSASDTSIAVGENLVDETIAGRISFAGHRVDSGDGMTWTWDGGSNRATLALTGLGTELIALGLNVGQVVHVGSIASVGGAIQNALENSAANDMFGYARVYSISADAVVFDKVDAALQFTDGTVSTDVDLLFGEFVRNVVTTASDYIERSFHFEMELPNLNTGGAAKYQYSAGNFANTVAVELPLADKATVAFAFVGTDTADPVVAGSRKTGADSATDPVDTAAMNTTLDIARLRLTDIDEGGLSTDFKSLTITLNNNVTPEKVLGQLGAAYMNAGDFEVDLELQLVFTESAVIDRIRANTTVSMDFILKNDDGVIAVDLPSMTLGGGDREFPVNESVLINLLGMTHEDDTFGTSIGVSILPVPLP